MTDAYVWIVEVIREQRGYDIDYRSASKSEDLAEMRRILEYHLAARDRRFSEAIEAQSQTAITHYKKQPA